MLSDRHVHTPYCLHGSSDAMENYVKVAIEAGLESLTFTEHAPLPMADPLPDKDSSMRPEDVDAYLAEVRTLAKKYQGIMKSTPVLSWTTSKERNRKHVPFWKNIPRQSLTRS